MKTSLGGGPGGSCAQGHLCPKIWVAPLSWNVEVFTLQEGPHTPLILGYHEGFLVLPRLITDCLSLGNTSSEGQNDFRPPGPGIRRQALPGSQSPHPEKAGPRHTLTTAVSVDADVDRALFIRVSPCQSIAMLDLAGRLCPCHPCDLMSCVSCAQRQPRGASIGGRGRGTTPRPAERPPGAKPGA